MSHNVALKGTKLKDLTALRIACDELAKEGAKIRFDETAKTFRTYHGEDPKCDAAIIMGNGTLDIGLRKTADGSYEPVFDPYGFSADLSVDGKAVNFNEPKAASGRARYGNADYDEQYARSRIGKLLQRYGVVVTERMAAKSGKTYSRVKNAETGALVVTLNG